MISKMSSTTNPAFAFVVTSILNSNKSAKILSKAKKENESSSNPTTDVKNSVSNNETNGSVTTVNDVSKNQNKPPKESKETLKPKDVDKIFQSNLDMEDKEKEKRLTLIATKGVVQLFNVVREKQRSLKHELEEAGPSESKRIKVLTKFKDNAAAELDNVAKNNKSNNKTVQKKRWSVLEEDYMQGSKFKDWDKEDDSD